MRGSEQSHPKEKEKEEGKGVISGGFQIAEDRREAKTKGERERYLQLMAAFQRRGPRDKKDFINEQCIKLEEKYRRGKNRDLLIKIGNIKGEFWL